MKTYQKIGFNILMKLAKNHKKIPSIFFFFGTSDSSDISMSPGARSVKVLRVI